MAGIVNDSLLLPNTSATGVEGEIKFGGNRFIHNYGSGNIFVGQNAGNTTLAPLGSVQNSGFGLNALQSLNSVGADLNCAFGKDSLKLLTDNNGNTAIGSLTLGGLVTGMKNSALGFAAGSAYVGAESSNICIMNNGLAAESNTLRIGTTGAGAGQQNRAFIAGTYGITPATAATTTVPLIDGAGQLGSLGLMTNGQLIIGSTGAAPVLATISAGANITVTNAAGAITIAAVGLTDYAYTNVNTTPYVVAAGDEYMSVDTSAAAITIKLPDAATAGHVYIIKDRSGACTTRNITVTTVTGAVLIDGAATYVMNTDYQSIQLMGNGTSYEIF